MKDMRQTWNISKQSPKVQSTTKGPMLECGSGVTTILMGILCGRRNVEVWSLEHFGEWRDRVSETLKSQRYFRRACLLLSAGRVRRFRLVRSTTGGNAERVLAGNLRRTAGDYQRGSLRASAGGRRSASCWFDDFTWTMQGVPVR